MYRRSDLGKRCKCARRVGRRSAIPNRSFQPRNLQISVNFLLSDCSGLGILRGQEEREGGISQLRHAVAWKDLRAHAPLLSPRNPGWFAAYTSRNTRRPAVVYTSLLATHA